VHEGWGRWGYKKDEKKYECEPESEEEEAKVQNGVGYSEGKVLLSHVGDRDGNRAVNGSAIAVPLRA
jgi:hypothetical protein